MSKIRTILCALILALAAIAASASLQGLRLQRPSVIPAKPQNALRIATHNVHYIWSARSQGPWSVAHWEVRKSALDEMFKSLDADLIGFQEMQSFSMRNLGRGENLALSYFLEQNSDFAAAAVGNTRVFPSTQPILYRSEAFDVLDQGWFFFSKTPDVIYSRTFNGSFPAFASWAEFKDKRNGRVFKVINVHTDYASRSNRLQTADLIAERIAPWIAAGEAVILLGDLNARYGAKTMRLLESAGLKFNKTQGASVHFERGLHLFGAIDHIGTAGFEAIVGEASGIYHPKPDGVWPSDHHPVLMDLLQNP